MDNDQVHAQKYRPPLFELRDDLSELGSSDSGAASRWPTPFEDDDLDVPESDMWWNYF